MKTAATPGITRAAAVSIETMRAWAWFERRKASASAPATCRSSTKLPAPVKSRGSSVRLIRAPMIFGRRFAWSVIGVGSLAERLPLPVVVAADHDRAVGSDAPDLGERFFQCLHVPGVLRDDAVE